jgi:hypothetical protein
METGNIVPFEERLERGDKTTLHTKKYLEDKWYQCNFVIDPGMWKITGGNGKDLLREIDLMYGDLIVEDHYLIDSKSNYISFKSAKRFLGDYFFVWNSSFADCLVLKPEDVRELDISKTIFLPSGDRGFSFEQLSQLPYIRIQDLKLAYKKPI